MSSDHQNGVNGHSKAAGAGLVWKVGLLNHQNKYLTAESFGKLNISGKALKKKQLWALEPAPGRAPHEEDQVFIRDYQGKYLSTDKYGNVTLVDEPEEGSSDIRFVVEYPPPSSQYAGRWLFRNVTDDNYLGCGQGEGVTCFQKGRNTCGPREHWTVQLSLHPQVNIRNVNRKRFAHLCQDELQCTELVPWGADALVLLEFVEGKYAIRTSDNRYLRNDGGLDTQVGDDSLFYLEIRAGKDPSSAGLAFRDREGRYLTAVGSTATLRHGKEGLKPCTKDDLFVIQDSHPQVALISNAGKLVSVKQGMDVSANQEEETDTEVFQLEYQGETTNKWAIRSSNNSVWTLVSGGGVQDKARSVATESLYDLEWQGDGTVGIKASNGKYVSHKNTGALVASADSLSEKEKFKVRLINRPLLVLKSCHGFIGPKPKSSEYICNKASFDIIFLEGLPDGCYSLKDGNGKFWSLDDSNNIVADGNIPTPFIIEFHRQSHVTIKAPNGHLLKSEQNGLFRALGTEVNEDTLLEF